MTGWDLSPVLRGILWMASNGCGKLWVAGAYPAEWRAGVGTNLKHTHKIDLEVTTIKQAKAFR